MTAKTTLGFIGLGVMGEPMCRHLVQKSGAQVTIHDINAEPVARLEALGARDGGSVAEVAKADIVFISLPSGAHLQKVCEGPGGLLEHARPGQTIVDLSTSPLKLTRALAAAFNAKGADYADSPVARTRAAAEAGTLAITVGGTPDVFARIEPLLRCFAAEVTHCGDVGSGQVVKILNNMVMVGTVTALCEAAAIAETAGIKTAALYEAFSKGSADSFALRNHGFKAVAARQFPERVFSTDYMLKDVSYALEMAKDGGIEAREAALGASLLTEASQKGFGADYWPVIIKIIEGSAK
ncbi:NAD(P)-dependent oxidoreductase [Aquabacter sp. CN5-332]|uniref:NAD(P)-dependent oxidoreductase n=1 Tax=Aquabacter sp. CN5-332 TaxID=3156608 RepID=UPI0032B5C94C